MGEKPGNPQLAALCPTAEEPYRVTETSFGELKVYRVESKSLFLLAGILLTCAFNLGVAEKKVSLILEPPNPQVGQDVTFTVRGGPQRFALCEWSREHRKGEPATILEYLPGSTPQERKGIGHSGRETVRPDCSLRIANLRPSDTGNYSIIFETRQESDQTTSQQPDEFYQGSVYLEMSAFTQITIRVVSEPQHPKQGEEVTLTPQETPDEILFCEWFKKGSSGNTQSIIQYDVREQEDTSRRERVTLRPGCSLHMRELTTADSGTYTVKMQVHLDRGQPGQGRRPQESGEIQEYSGQIELQVNQDSNTNQQKGGAAKSAGLSYSAGLVALLAFFAWTDAFTSLFHALCRGNNPSCSVRKVK
ncbi:UNVERIFIED_CONTAM: hypothetical protein K2H54_031882 [Gekko kuhli]